ncbi:rhomboid family intramembrane serine protease [Listeria welshimeri]|nr:rhomboid family intramembrane serine protease [Listeria welshimeri]
MKFLHTYIVSFVFLFLNLSMFTTEYIKYGNNVINSLSPYELISLGGKYIFISVFVHGSAIHFLSNMFMFCILGFRLEKKIGHLKFITLIILSVFFSELSVLVISQQNVVSVGASGVIYALLGSYMLLNLDKIRKKCDNEFYLIVLIFLISLLYTIYGDGISLIAHLSGFIVGAIFMFFSKIILNMEDYN